MIVVAAIFLILPYTISCSGDGNIHLLEEDIAIALHNCQTNKTQTNDGKRQRRSDRNYSDTSPRIDANTRQEKNQYNHQKRDYADQMNVINNTDNDRYGSDYGNNGENFINNVPRPVHRQSYNVSSNSSRYKRSDLLFRKEDSDQCLSQCVFANLEVVDTHGIPREAELWAKVQTSVASQQTRALLRDQIRACFQELQSESEDNGCSYSNKLERCLMLSLSDRRQMRETSANQYHNSGRTENAKTYDRGHSQSKRN